MIHDDLSISKPQTFLLPCELVVSTFQKENQSEKWVTFKEFRSKLPSAINEISKGLGEALANRSEESLAQSKKAEKTFKPTDDP
mgnify:CR=1 FL=1